MTAYRKKLIEVALPPNAVNKASAREKSIRHGPPSTCESGFGATSVKYELAALVALSEEAA